MIKALSGQDDPCYNKIISIAKDDGMSEAGEIKDVYALKDKYSNQFDALAQGLWQRMIKTKSEMTDTAGDELSANMLALLAIGRATAEPPMPVKSLLSEQGKDRAKNKEALRGMITRFISTAETDPPRKSAAEKAKLEEDLGTFRSDLKNMQVQELKGENVNIDEAESKEQSPDFPVLIRALQQFNSRVDHIAKKITDPKQRTDAIRSLLDDSQSPLSPERLKLLYRRPNPTMLSAPMPGSERDDQRKGRNFNQSVRLRK